MPHNETAPATPWLDDREQAAWRAYVLSSMRLITLLDRELQQRADLPMSYYEILVLLSEAPTRSLRMSELAEATHSLPSRITHAVGRLEKAGWIERRNCASDRRAWYAQLTDLGFATVEAAAPAHVDGVRRHLLDHLTEEDVEDLHRIFTKVRDHLDGSWSACSQAAEEAQEVEGSCQEIRDEIRDGGCPETDEGGC